MSGAWLVLFIGLWLVCITLVLLVLGLSRRIDVLESRDSPGAPRPGDELRGRFLGRQLADVAVEAGVAPNASDVAGLYLFVSEHCGPCQLLASDLAEETDGRVADVVGSRVTIITDQSGAFDGLGATSVIVDPDGLVMSKFAVSATPTGIALDEQGVVTEALIANRLRDVRRLARTIHEPDATLNIVLPT